MIAATISAGFSGKKESIEKHLLKWGKDVQPSWQEVERKMMAFARAHNEKVRKERGG